MLANCSISTPVNACRGKRVKNLSKWVLVFSVLVLTVAQAPITTAAIDPNEPTPMIVTITGAPGDGNTALAAAIHGELARVGLPISDQGRRLKYRLDVHVTVGQVGDDGQQPVEAKWRLRNPEGKKQGTRTQRVEVPDGELNGPWGYDASDAAYAAAQGILRLLRQ